MLSIRVSCGVGARTNSFGQLGQGAVSSSELIPGQVRDISSDVHLATGWSHACAVHTAMGFVSCWGANASGQLGDGSYQDHRIPTLIPGSNGLKNITVGQNSTCALNEIGHVWCWGSNEFGQLNNNATYTNAPHPVEVSP